MSFVPNVNIDVVILWMSEKERIYELSVFNIC